MIREINSVRRTIRGVLLKEYVEDIKLLLEAKDDTLFPGSFEDGGKNFSEKVRKQFLKNKKIKKIAGNRSLDSKDQKEQILAIIHK